MDEPIDPTRSEVERTLWHTLDEAGWSADQIRESFTAYRDGVLRRAAAEIREDADSLDVPGSPASPAAIQGMKHAADLIDPFA